MWTFGDTDAAYMIFVAQALRSEGCKVTVVTDSYGHPTGLVWTGRKATAKTPAKAA